MRYATILAAGLAAAVHTNSMAAPAECSQEPPLRDSGYYFQFNDAQPFDAVEIKKIKHFAKALEGRWRGNGIIIDCLERQRTNAGYRREFTFDGETISFNNGALELKGEQQIVDQPVVKTERFSLTPGHARSRGQRWHTLQFDNDHTMIYSEKYRRQTASGSQLVHVIYKVALENNVLQIDSKQYINGFFEQQTGTRLVRLAG